MLIDKSYTNFIMLHIYGEALDKLRVHLNMNLVKDFQQTAAKMVYMCVRY